MHVLGLSLDLNWFLQFIFTAFVIALGLLHVVKSTASKYFVVDANFEGGGDSAALVHDGGWTDRNGMPGVSGAGDACVVCGSLGNKKCSGCKAVRYCSQNCQSVHWKSEHKSKCKDFQLSGKTNLAQSATSHHGRKTSGVGVNNNTRVALVPGSGTSMTLLQAEKILFPYDEFVRLFNWDYPGFPPCGLLNCGNSCFANVVLQCLYYTRPLVAYLLEKGHQRECRRNDWCFLCEFQTHVERARQRLHPFSPINILSHLPSIGGNLGYGKQEDAHEFMRFAVDTMQSVCLDEFGGEKALHPSSQETTLIQHIFGGHLQSQVICTKCKKISNQYENMMDLTVEIQGDAVSLEECLDQFTVKEWLHGENMYKCDGCNDYVKAWKRLTIRRAPNILTIALKRFQSGRFGKLNKRVTFPETLDLSPYMSEAVDGTDVYKLYAVVVHVDMLNASFFGHYICYVKDFRGNWYRVDDCKVVSVALEEVLSEGAYMLLYSRVCARSSSLKTIEPLKTEEQQPVNRALEAEPHPKQAVDSITTAELINPISIPESLPSDGGPHSNNSDSEEALSLNTNSEALKEDQDDVEMTDPTYSSIVSKEIKVYGNGHSNAEEIASPEELENRLASSGVTSSTEADNLKCTLPSNSDIEDGNSANSTCAREVVSLNSSEISVPTWNGVCESDATSYDVSVAALGSVKEISDESDATSYDVSVAALGSVKEISDEINSLTSKHLPISSPKMEAAKSGRGFTISNGVDGAAGILAGGYTSSGAKLKPLFPPGFLGKRPRNKSMKGDENRPVESGELPSVSNVDNNCNGFSKPGFLTQKGGGIKDQAKSHLGCNGLSSSDFAQEQPEKCLDEVEMVNIEFSEPVNICNEVANSVVADENASNAIISDAEETILCGQNDDGIIENGFPCSHDVLSAAISLAVDGEVPELEATVQSGKIGPNSRRLAEASEGDLLVNVKTD